MVLVAFMEAYAIGRKYALQEGYPLHVNKVRYRSSHRRGLVTTTNLN